MSKEVTPEKLSKWLLRVRVETMCSEVAQILKQIQRADPSGEYSIVIGCESNGEANFSLMRAHGQKVESRINRYCPDASIKQPWKTGKAFGYRKWEVF